MIGPGIVEVTVFIERWYNSCLFNKQVLSEVLLF